MKKQRILKLTRLIFSILALVFLLTTSVWYPTQESDVIRRYTRPFEFDYIGWEIQAFWNKALGLSFGIAHHLTIDQQREIVQDYFQLLAQSREIEGELTRLYSEPGKSNTDMVNQLENDLTLLDRRLEHQSMLAEPVIQHQLSYAISSLGITRVGTPFPALLFQTTPLPKQLIISPRDEIRQERSISLVSDISLEEMIALEELVEENTDYSALVVPIGGVGTYPSMIIETTYLPNLLDTVAHEWIHNHLIFRPLGLRYLATPALRTMNETTANISGDEIMRETLLIFYPEYFRQEFVPAATLQANAAFFPLDNETGFSFSETMYQTRVHVDELLAQGKIKDAENFMDAQRQIFWENGYQLRKLNQAYFSFYGAYADSPFSAAGSDPVGEDVRLFRSQQDSLASFVWKMSWMFNYRQLRIAARAF